jgi:S-adenosylmethionine:tRNA ribosyltransferase-isomerase
VAKYPLLERDQSKLLVYKDKQIDDCCFSDLSKLLPDESMLVFNNTRVIHARLLFTKSTGAIIEVFCLEPTHPNSYEVSFSQTTACRWKCLVGNLKRWKGEELKKKISAGDQEINLLAKHIGAVEGGHEIQFSWDNSSYTFSEILEAAGSIPIPPYLNRVSEEMDRLVYQTVYASVKGSVAAPTAGLHFTDKIFKALDIKKVICRELTLHVGAGTFQPIKSDTLGEHQMHAENFSVDKSMIDELISHQGKIIAVGTTSVRTLESLYWIGCKIFDNPHISTEDIDVDQWEPYQYRSGQVQTKIALQAIQRWLLKKELNRLDTFTRIIILPGYQFRLIGGLITNFHQPKSTLLLLIAAVLGDDWKRVYAHALENDYRFLSYGDANLYLI